MSKKVLIAVGDCLHSRRAVEYAAKVSSAAKDVEYTIFHVEPLIPRIFSAAVEKDPKVREELDTLVHKSKEADRCFYRDFKDLIVDEGIAESRIEVVSQPMQKGIAKDILSRAEDGHYDAIVMARKALTPSRDFFIGTTATKVVEHALKTPVWVVAGENRYAKVMLAVDGSENSLRDVDHVTRMIGANPNLSVTLFHVVPHLRHYYSIELERENPYLQQILQGEDEHRMESFFEEAYARFQAAGMKRRQVEVKTNRQSHDISTAILQEAKTGGYGTVVVGRRGERDAFFTGQIALRLVQKVANQTLWVIP